jgi:hypothetical protein
VRYVHSCLTKDKFLAPSGAAYCVKGHVAPTELDRLAELHAIHISRLRRLWAPLMSGVGKLPVLVSDLLRLTE